MTKQEAIEWLRSSVLENCTECDGINTFGCEPKCQSLMALDIAIECIEKCIYDEESPCADCSQFGCRATNCIYGGRLE